VVYSESTGTSTTEYSYRYSTVLVLYWCCNDEGRLSCDVSAACTHVTCNPVTLLPAVQKFESATWAGCDLPERTPDQRRLGALAIASSSY
jgi:hypothetical protein